jgi:hypothetical protein
MIFPRQVEHANEGLGWPAARPRPTKSPFSDSWFVLELAGIRRLVVQITAIEQDNSPSSGGARE